MTNRRIIFGNHMARAAALFLLAGLVFLCPSNARASEPYAVTLTKHLTLHQSYPADAALYAIEGDVIIRLRIEKDGEISAFSFVLDPGHPLLRESVMKMLAAASPVPAPPETLFGKDTALDYMFPIAFRMELTPGSLIAIDRAFQQAVKEAFEGK